MSLGNQALGISYDLSGLLAIGALVLIAQCLGRDDIPGARRIGVIAIAANTVLSSLLAVVLFASASSLISWVDTPPEIVADTAAYVRVIGIAMVLNGFITVAAAVLRAFGHTIEILLFGIIGNVIYLGLDYVLIFGRFGLPEMGVQGAIWATLVVRIAGSLMFIWVLVHRLGFSIRSLSPKRMLEGVRNLRTVGELLRFSVPGAADNFTYNLAQLVLVKFVAALGTPALLMRNYTLTINGLVSLIVLTATQANETLIGYDKGADDHETARRRAIRTAVWTAASAMTISALLYIFAGLITRIFTDDPAVLRGVKQLLLAGIILEPFAAVMMILLGSLRSAGDPVIPVVFSIAITWLAVLPLAWYLMTRTGLGVTGLWIALAAGEIVKCAGLYLRWNRMRWAAGPATNP